MGALPRDAVTAHLLDTPAGEENVGVGLCRVAGRPQLPIQALGVFA
jgi:hypothetical protein